MSKVSSANDVEVRFIMFPLQRAAVLGVLNPPEVLAMIDASRTLTASSLYNALNRYGASLSCFFLKN